MSNNFAKAKAQNEMFAKSLSNQLRRIPRETLGVLAATTMYELMKHTKEDSSRAAANWNLHFGGGSPPMEWKPKEYLTEGIGERGSKRAYRASMRAVKRQYYGYKRSKYGNLQEPTEGGMIDLKLNISQGKGLLARASQAIFGITKVTIFNPISGVSIYGDRAFGGMAMTAQGVVPASLAEIKSTFLPALMSDISAKVSSRIGSRSSR